MAENIPQTNGFMMVTAEGTQVEQGVITHTEYASALTFAPTWVCTPSKFPLSRTTVAMNSSELKPEGTGSNLRLVMSRTLKYVTPHSVFFLNKHQGPGKTQRRQKTASTELFSAGDVRSEEHVVEAIVEKDRCSIVE
jgi:hypothetical protein